MCNEKRIKNIIYPSLLFCSYFSCSGNNNTLNMLGTGEGERCRTVCVRTVADRLQDIGDEKQGGSLYVQHEKQAPSLNAAIASDLLNEVNRTAIWREEKQLDVLVALSSKVLELIDQAPDHTYREDLGNPLRALLQASPLLLSTLIGKYENTSKSGVKALLCKEIVASIKNNPNNEFNNILAFQLQQIMNSDHVVTTSLIMEYGDSELFNSLKLQPAPKTKSFLQTMTGIQSCFSTTQDVNTSAQNSSLLKKASEKLQTNLQKILDEKGFGELDLEGGFFVKKQGMTLVASTLSKTAIQFQKNNIYCLRHESAKEHILYILPPDNSDYNGATYRPFFFGEYNPEWTQKETSAIPKKHKGSAPWLLPQFCVMGETTCIQAPFQNVADATKEVGAQKPYDRIVIAGHGWFDNSNNFYTLMSPFYQLTSNNIHSFIQHLRDNGLLKESGNFKDNTRITLLSCNGANMISALSKAAPRLICEACPQGINYFSFREHQGEVVPVFYERRSSDLKSLFELPVKRYLGGRPLDRL